MNPLQALFGLSNLQKKTLINLLKGPLSSTTSEVCLCQALGNECGKFVYVALVACEAQGFTRPQLLAVLDVDILSDFSHESFSWVITGIASPSMPRRDTAVVYRSLIQQAQKEVIISTYSIYNGKELFTALHEKMVRDSSLRVKILCDIKRAPGDTSMASEIVARFKRGFLRKQWPGEPLPEIYYFPAALSLDPESKAVLHAKCVIIDGCTALVGSANVTPSAHEKNIEVGMMIEDAQSVSGLRRYFMELIESGVLMPS